MRKTGFFLYWDSSAILSVLVEDTHTARALAAFKKSETRFVSSLGVAEVLGVLSRQSNVAVRAKSSDFLGDLEKGFWNPVHANPSPATLGRLSNRHPLRGADLWHLGLAWDMGRELSELKVITFDRQLEAALRNEDLLFE